MEPVLTWRFDQDLTMMRGFERRLVENFCKSGATMPSKMNLMKNEHWKESYTGEIRK